MRVQVLEIKKHKYIESEKAGFDRGNECCHEWIELYAKEFYLNYWREYERNN